MLETTQCTTCETESLKVFLGDSRTVGMDRSIEDTESEKYIAKGSMGYKWLTENAWPEFEKVIAENEGKHIDAVINFGVNDLANEEKYADFINEHIKDLPENVHLSYASVNPTNGSYAKMTERIETFNKKIKEDLDSSVTFIDSYKWLMDNGFSSFDGLHYGTETNQKIHDYWTMCMDEADEAESYKVAETKKVPSTNIVVVNITL